MLYILKKDVAAKAKIIQRDTAPCLFVNFYESTPPLVWQYNLKKASVFRLFLQQDEAGSWDLGYETAKEPFKVVAHFDERAEAEESYTAIQKVLARGKGLTFRSFFKGILYVIFFLILFNILMLFFVPAASNMTDVQVGGNETSAVSGGQAQIKTGVPVAADDVLPANPY